MPRAAAPRHDPERHPEGVHGARDVHLPAAAVAPPHHRHLRVRARGRCRGGTPSRSAATTSARPAATPCRRSRSRWPTASRTSKPRSRRGSTSTRFGAQLSFFFNVHNNLIEEVAKFRAARRMWSRIMQERFGAKTDRARALRFHCQTAGDDAHGAAAARTTSCASRCRRSPPCSAAASRSTRTASTRRSACRRARRRPSRSGRSRSSRTRSGVADFVDALGGSYAIESLTDRLEKRGRASTSRASTSSAAWSRHRAGLPAARDPEHGVRVPARDRAQGAAHRRA